MIISADPPPGALFVDSRPPADYARGHLEGAINLDLSGFRGRLRSEEELGQLERALADLNGRIGAAPERPVVVYDAGFNTRLTKTAFMLALGGLEVHLWPQGWEPQATQTAPTTPTPSKPWARLDRDILLTADEILAQPGLLLLDVREPHEFASGHIPGARNLPLSAFRADNAGSLGLSPGQEVGVHCRSGARSASAFWLLRQQGVRARNYLGSMLEWEAEADLPVER
ncbi:MAG: rhodanese-like domain-containing protein [Meiothermus sp.]|uniref:sulfurtransferase n=1 Tax=Meiothermus sp. TaxID=1955249 RepID=UPI0025CCD04A|nr:rhodanese-like domain-containing protein [Meiothermus sp.]MCS7058471.1 rhodanese-like domain-containing protein [Meiothermus sp.]MCS7193395.1 rhodanese-like domain-containing protein [Meiothermus sp.]MCX7739796.1 rhodanese-like domain-containing protein [Meiothermus sp.]MDW8090908.1 rhodanese-like domain-containing protein [Meiothermus sp.]MDW8482047.1 rhodanese-like domain-containing protein [Meiothermus sp.]